MSDYINILAESDPTLKIVIGLIFAGIWVVAQILSALGKNKEKTRAPDANYPAGLPPEAPLPPPRPARQTPRPVKKRVETKQRQRLDRQQTQRVEQQVERMHPPQRSMQVPAGRVPPLPPAQQPSSQPVERVIGLVAKPVARATPKGPTSAQRLTAILRPKNLRKEFILTELLQPPLALRERRD
jgi:hypothetical protein